MQAKQGQCPTFQLGVVYTTEGALVALTSNGLRPLA
jgi:hypothetical protein